MSRPRVHTAPLDGNQQRIDELEYFLEGIGRILFGDQGEDFRALAGFVPRTRNLSALVALTRAQPAREVAEDLATLYRELETEVRGTTATPSVEAPVRTSVFNYRRYAELRDHPEKLLEHVPPTQRMEVLDLMTAGVRALSPITARLSAFAWLGVVGLPDLQAELGGGAPAVALADPSPGTAEGIELILTGTLATTARRGRVGKGLRAWATAAHAELTADYRSQLARLAGKTEPLT